MNARNHADEQWDANLRSMAETMDMPAAAPRDLRARCAAVLKGDIKVKNHQRSWRTALFSTVGIAAAIVVLFGFFGLPHGQTEVNAAVILRTLNEQVQASEGIRVSIDSLVFEGVSIDGQIQVCGDGIAGDIKVDVEARDDRPSVSLDATLGIQSDSGWVLLRELEIGDPQVQAMVWLFAPPGRETLITLPMEETGVNFGTDLENLKDEEVAELINALIDAHEEVGATIEDQPDGTILLTLPIRDTQTLEALKSLHGIVDADSINIGAGAGNAADKGGPFIDFSVSVTGGEEDAAPAIHEHVHQRAESGQSELVGTTIKILYSPADSAVRWFRIENFGEAGGSIDISFEPASIDLSRLDQASVMNDNVHVVDLAAAMKMFGERGQEASGGSTPED